MGEATNIEWTQASWNPWHGCIKVSAGCKNCYMYTDKARYGQDPRIVQRSKSTFTQPLRQKEPRLIFTCSWSDFFIQEADEWRDEAWDIIRRTPQHTYQILTKRPERIQECLPQDWRERADPYPNVWLGVSVENQAAADKRIDELMYIPAAVRFLSIEPLLEPVTLTECRKTQYNHLDTLRGGLIHWAIVGGESGPNARPMQADWVRKLRDECVSNNVAFFFKQWGGVNKKQTGRVLDGRTWDEMPELNHDHLPDL